MRTHGQICVLTQILHICKICIRMQIWSCVHGFRRLTVTLVDVVSRINNFHCHFPFAAWRPLDNVEDRRHTCLLNYVSGKWKYMYRLVNYCKPIHFTRAMSISQFSSEREIREKCIAAKSPRRHVVYIVLV